MGGPKVYLIGLPALGHPGGSRYLGFRPFIEHEHLTPPVKFRFFKSYWGWRLDNAITALSPRPYYTLGLFLMECKAAIHMLFHRRTLYHAVKADVDLCMLPRISRLTGNFLVASFHEPAEMLPFWRIEAWMTRYLAAVILLGESQRRHFETLVPSERIHVVPHGVDTGFFRPVDRRGNQPTCVTVGSHMRDADTLSRAMERVWEANPVVRLFVIGARRPHDPNRPPDLEDPRVTYLDNINDDELRAIYDESTVAVLSLKSAVANNALIEAMASGLPVVATDTGDVRSYLGDETGLVVPPGDPDALAQGIVRILEDAPLAATMGANGRQRALHYDNRLVAERLSNVYRQAVGMDR